MAVQPPPITTPVIDPISGTMNRAWLGFFQSLVGQLTTAVSSGISPGEVGTTELAALAVTLGKLAAGVIRVTGSRASPISISASGGIAPVGKWFEAIFVQGNGGPTDITANPQIAAGTAGQFLLLIGRSSINTLQLDDGSGVTANGSFVMGQDDTALYLNDGTTWVEISRKAAA